MIIYLINSNSASYNMLNNYKLQYYAFILGKTLICCKTVWDNFEKIVETLGGPLEKKRAAELKDLVTVYEDCYGGLISFVSKL